MLPEEDNKIQNKILKHKKGFERLEIAFELNNFSRELIKTKLKNSKPNLSEEKLENLVVERFKTL